MNNTTELKRSLNQQVEAVCHHLLPNGKKIGHEWRVGSINGEPGQSLGVHLSGSKVGTWGDFQTGDTGDLLELWRRVRGLSFPETVQEVSVYLGGSLTLKSNVNSIKKPVDFAPVQTKSYSTPDLSGCVETGKLPQSVLDYLTQDRKLSIETIQQFNIMGCVDREGGEIVFPYQRHGQLKLGKFLSLQRASGKKQVRSTPDSEPILFGWQALVNPEDSQSPLLITEGEIDAMSMTQYGFRSLSIPFGAGIGAKLNWIEREFEAIEPFKDIVLCLDMDEEGQRTAQEIAKRLGLYRCRLMSLPYKDANECLQQGITPEEMSRLVEQAKPFDPAELKSASNFEDATLDLFYPQDTHEVGFKLPWRYAEDKFRIRPGELSIWAGVNGHGKSQVLGHMMLDLMMKQEQRVCIASMEIKPSRLLERMTRQAAAMAKPSPNYLKHIFQAYTDKLWLFDVTGTAKADTILNVFEYAYRRYGITHFVIDSLMKCGFSDDDYTKQKAFVDALCDFKNNFNVHIHLVAHCRKGGSEYEEPGKFDIKGSGSLTDLADNVFTVWRNKAKELALASTKADPSQTSKPDGFIHCQKQRNGDWEGKINLWFDKDSFQYLGSPEQKPIRYVNYSELENAAA